MDNIDDLIEWDNKPQQKSIENKTNNIDDLIEWDTPSVEEPKQDISKEDSGNWFVDAFNTAGNFLLDVTGVNSLYDAGKELLGDDEKPNLSTEELARKAQQAEKANAQNYIKEHLANIIYNITDNEEGLKNLEKLRIDNANKIVDTLSNFTDMEIEARDYNGEIKYIAKDKDGKETEITQNWVKDFLGNLADAKGETALGTAGGLAGYKKGKDLGKKAGSIVEKASGVLTKKIPFAGKYISKGLGKLTDWSIRSIGSGGGAALGASVGAFADTLNAQFNIGQQLDLAKGIDNAEDAAKMSLALGILTKPFFAGVSLSSKGLKNLISFFGTGNINGARALLKAEADMSDEQIKQFTQEFENVFGELKGMTKTQKDIYLLSLLPQNIGKLERASKHAYGIETKNFLNDLGKEITKKSESLYTKEAVTEFRDFIKDSNLPKTSLKKSIIKDSATVDSITESLLKQVDSLENNYKEIMNSLSPKLRKNIEGALLHKLLNKNTTMVNGKYGINFKNMADTLDKIDLKSSEAKEFANVIKGSSKLINNSYDILSSLSKETLPITVGIANTPFARLRTFFSNRFYQNFLAPLTGADMAVIANLKILLDKPMNKVAFDDLAKKLNINKKEAEEIGKEFRENVIKQQELVKNIDQNMPIQGQVLDNIANTQTKATYRTKKEDIFNMYPKETQFIKDYSTENSSQSTFSTSKDLVNSLLIERNPEADLNIIMDDLYRSSTKRTKDIISKLGRGLLKDTAIPKILQKDILKNKSILKNNGIIVDDIEATILTNQLIKDTAENNADTIAYKRSLAELNKERYRKAKELKNSNL